MATRFDAFVTAMSARRPRLLAVPVVLALLVYFLYHATKFQLYATFVDPGMTVDFTIIYRQSARIMATGHYPDLGAPGDFFPYAPPMVMLFSVLTWTELPVARVVWELVKLAALFYLLCEGLRLVGAGRRPERWLVVVGTVLCADPFLHWELRAHTNSLIYLALVVGAIANARRPWRAGPLLALSVTLKLYSGIFLPWLLWRRRYGWLATALGALGLLWVALPVAVFGVEHTIALYREWWSQVVFAGTPEFYASTAPLVTLRHGLVGAFGVAPFGTAMTLLLGGFRLAWIGLLAAYFLAGRRAPALSAAGLASDATVLLLAPLPFSPILQPPHGVVALLGILVFVAVALDPRRSMALRLAAAAAALFGFVLGKLVPDWSVRGLVVFLTFVVVVFGLMVLRMAAGRDGAAGEPDDRSAPVSDAPVD